MYVQVKLLFPAERQLCDQIWSRLDPHREKAFADVTDSSVHMLLSFGEAVARSKKTPEKLFVLLDMYEIMRDIEPEVIISLLYLREGDTLIYFFLILAVIHEHGVASQVQGSCKLVIPLKAKLYPVI